MHRSTSWVTKVERGVRRVDSMSALLELARALDVPLSQLSGRFDLMPTLGSEPGGKALIDLRQTLDRSASIRSALPRNVPGTMAGLRHRLKAENLAHRVDIIDVDLLDLPSTVEPADAVWTSCSWHYSINHRRPLDDFLTAMKNLCRPGAGLFGAEYMMPVEPRHFAMRHYPEEGELRRYFTGWDILWEVYTPQFAEAPHVEQLHEHIHRMGLLIARPHQTTTGTA